MKICLECRKHFVSNDWHCPHCGYEPAKVGTFVNLSLGSQTQNAGFNPALFEQYAELETRHFWFVGRNKIICDAISARFEGARNMLEIGCGTGGVLAEMRRNFPALKLSGGDAFLRGLAYAAQRNPDADLYQMDAVNIPFWEEFEIVAAFDVLEHVEDDERMLRQLFTACRPGGGIVVTVPQHPFLWSRTDEYAHHKRRYTRKDLLTKIEKAGFKVERVTSFVSLLLPAMMLSRFMQRKRPLREDSIDDGFRISPLVSKLLGWVFSVEQKAIRLGLSFPAGGSLLLVARKNLAPYRNATPHSATDSLKLDEANYVMRRNCTCRLPAAPPISSNFPRPKPPVLDHSPPS